MKSLELSLANRLAEIEPVSRRIRDLAEQRGVPTSVIAKVEVALDELLGNVITYAYSDTAHHEIAVSIDFGEHELAVTISDDGSPFDPTEHAAPVTTSSIEKQEIGGLGIRLVRRLMDEIRYERTNDKNVVTIVKHFHDPTPSNEGTT